MTLRSLSFHIAASACVLAQQAPHFTVKEAIQAEWARKPPLLTEEAKAKLPPADRARLELTLQRIGAPGAPELLPPELAHPTVEQWLKKAAEARTPADRFAALFFLNRFKSPQALDALAGLNAKDAKHWPKHLHLEAGIATARLNGAVVKDDLKAFLDALQQLGKIDPVRAQAAQLRLLTEGKERALLPSISYTPKNLFWMVDALSRLPESARAQLHQKSPGSDDSNDNVILGLSPLHRPSFLTFLNGDEALARGYFDAYMARTLETYSPVRKTFFNRVVLDIWAGRHPSTIDQKIRAASLLDRMEPSTLETVLPALRSPNQDPLVLAAALPALRKVLPAQADELRDQLLVGTHAIARSAAIEDCLNAPTDLPNLTARTWKDAEFEPQQTLIQSYARWKMSPEDQKAQLTPWLQHPDWACRWEAYQALKKLDPTTPWPAAPAPSQEQAVILNMAEQLAAAGKPVRMRIRFHGKRSITLRLDPTVAPINVANLVHLAQKGFFNGRRVPRIVPDFVVQMGSPYDTMDGGPGYSVRCENSLNGYGPGSVGMALGGKDTGGSQFFITTNATPHLTGKYTRMGEVEDLDHALPILDALELGATILRVEVLTP